LQKVKAEHMRFANIIFQTILILTVILLLALRPLDTSTLILVWCIQLFLGPLQVIRALIDVIHRLEYWKWKLYYLICCVVYIFLILPILLFQIHISQRVIEIALTAPAWFLALNSYALTILSKFFPNKRSSFLPHLSF
jgi:hypothetical protein